MDRAGGRLWCILLLGLETSIFKFGFFSGPNHHRVGIAGQYVHCVVGRLGFFLHSFFFRFKGFFRCFIILILRWFNHEELALFVVMFLAPQGGVGLDMAGRGVTLVLRTSWFNGSSWIRAKEIVTIRVYG
ncbi:hypothetical protein BHE74_00048071 [Ensete ventricosum]|nr:hypothetical protein BHE74_00048071 [Ensete ventricosum]